MALFKDSFNYQELIDCAKGKLAGVDFPKLPLPPMLMFDEVTSIKETGGAYNKGTAHAQLEITPDKWFFPCHFKTNLNGFFHEFRKKTQMKDKDCV